MSTAGETITEERARLVRALGARQSELLRGVANTARDILLNNPSGKDLPEDERRRLRDFFDSFAASGEIQLRVVRLDSTELR